MKYIYYTSYIIHNGAMETNQYRNVPDVSCGVRNPLHSECGQVSLDWGHANCKIGSRPNYLSMVFWNHFSQIQFFWLTRGQNHHHFDRIGHFLQFSFFLILHDFICKESLRSWKSWYLYFSTQNASFWQNCCIFYLGRRSFGGKFSFSWKFPGMKFLWSFPSPTPTFGSSLSEA